MHNRISTFPEDPPEAREEGGQEPQAIGEILAELLAQYQRRFPDLKIAVVETSASAV